MVNVYKQSLSLLVTPLFNELMKLLKQVDHLMRNILFSGNEVLQQIGVLLS
jgi:hypothetical protein